MRFKADIGIIGAMADEVDEIISHLGSPRTETVSGIEFHLGTLFGKKVAVAKCGVGKVFAAICAEAMILRYSPRLVVNSGVGGALDARLRPCDIVIADRVVQYDMDTSPIGDPVGLISGINRIFFESDERASQILASAAEEQGVRCLVGTVATGDRFVSTMEEKEYITSHFDASACEMEGGAIAHTAYVNGTPFAVIRAISDSADGDASMDYPVFLPIAVRTSAALTLALVEKY